jgi:hypothetical protein
MVDPKFLPHGELHYKWKGGRKNNTAGYVMIRDPNNPMSESNGYVLEHRLIMSKKLNRILTEDELVHHINGIKNDNRLENLDLISIADHIRHHKSWPKQDIELIRKYYNNAPREYLMNLFPTKSWEAIKFQGQKQGIKRKYMRRKTGTNMNKRIGVK